MHFDSFFYVPNMCVSPNVTTTICFDINMQGISTAKMNCLVACIIWSVRILILLFPINTIWCTCCYCLHYNYLAIFINLIQSFHSKSIRRGIIRPNKINYKFWHANSSVYQKTFVFYPNIAVYAIFVFDLFLESYDKKTLLVSLKKFFSSRLDKNHLLKDSRLRHSKVASYFFMLSIMVIILKRFLR